jgi:N-acetyl-gamma-glutamylphosphate reductase
VAIAKRIDEAVTGDPVLLRLLCAHPGVVQARLGDSAGLGLDFCEGIWHRKISAGDATTPLAGLVEMVDNNPLVCADLFSTPDPVSTLALIALGPLIQAGLPTEPPVLLTSGGSVAGVSAFLSRAGWPHGVTLEEGEAELGPVLALNAFARIPTPDDPADLDSLYAEHFGHSFFVRLADDGPWDTERVVGKPFALYRLRITLDEGESLLTIQTMADKDGKCGAAQVLHAMNVMAGFEDSLGL